MILRMCQKNQVFLCRMIEKKLRELCRKLDKKGTVYKDQLDTVQVWTELMLAKKEMEQFHRSKEVHEDVNLPEEDDNDG